VRVYLVLLLLVSACDPGKTRCGTGHVGTTGMCTDDVCDPNPCGDGVVCTAGASGPSCSHCNTGEHDDGKGGCTTDACVPDPCHGGRVCVAGACSCAPGTHDDQGNCVPDTVCSPTTCSGHGTCTDNAGTIACNCDPGFSGSACAGCATGFHSDGTGGCTTDVCVPNPCVTPHQTICTTGTSGDAQCGCDPGYHDQGGTCVLDESCVPDPCNGHGVCSVAAGRTSCACTMGWGGVHCDACAAGYHSDGLGGCNQSACLPNPCTAPHQTVCAGGVCSCDIGWHDDGAGACTQDPCAPNPCLASNQSCRLGSGGAAECYTPACDDGNPCTDDSVAGGNCKHVNRGNGSTCQTSLCKSAETCQAGVCQGGGARDCSDGNPCTKDTCSTTLGCQHANDDTLVPADSYTCTIDSCASGVASHTVSNAACDDGKWCTGVEICDPTAGSDSRGCRATQVPTPPTGAGPCAHYGACDEASHTFAFLPSGAGTACDDGIGCTNGDACDGKGACRGTALQSCVGALGCAGTSSYTSTIDIPVGLVKGTITLGGQPLPASYKNYDGGDFYLVAKDTGAWHSVASYSYWYASGSYLLHGDTFATRMVTGVYDLVYRRYWDRTSNFVTITDAADTQVSGLRVLQQNIVVGPGTNVMTFDIPVSTVSGHITIGGADLPASYKNYDGGAFYLVAKDTGAKHGLASYSYWYSAGSYLLHGADYSTRMIPGTYDLIYERYWDKTSDFVTITDAADTQINGRRIVKAGVVIPAGASTLNLDIPVATVSGHLTLGGVDLPATYKNYDGGNVYLVAKDTGAKHGLNSYSYWYSAGNYVLHGADYSARIIPGTYDLVYERYWDKTSDFVTMTDAADTQINGRRVLQANLVIAPGTSTLNIDIPVGTVSGHITLGGADLPATYKNYDGGNLYLVARDTGAKHGLNSYSYWYSAGNYVLHGADYSVRMMPGTYDLVYERYWDKTSDFVTITDSADTQINGRRIIKAGVVIPAGASTLNIDIPVGTVSGHITLGGAELPATYKNYDGASLYLIARDTGAKHGLASYSYWYSAGSYVLHGADFSVRMVPGTYDVVYERYWDKTSNYVTLTDPADTQVNGRRVIKAGVVIPAGTSTLNLDIPVTTLSGNITEAGQPLPPTYKNYDGADLALVAVDTAAEHSLASFSYWYASGSYVLHGDTYATRMIPGTYDLRYQRYWDRTNNTVTLTDAADTQVNGRRILNRCVAVGN